MEEARAELEKQGYTFEETTAPIPSIDSDSGSFAKVTVRHRGSFVVMVITKTPDEAMASALTLAREHEPVAA